MRWNSIVFKLGLIIFIILVSVLLPLIYAINQLFSGFYLSENHHQIDRLADKYSNILKSTEDLESLSTVASLTETKICIIDQEGKILYSSNKGLFRSGNHVSNKLLQTLNSKQTIQIEYQHPTNNTNYIVSGKPLRLSNKVSGGLLVFSDAEHIKNSVRHMQLLLVVSLVGALFIALGFTYIASKKLASPLLEMEKVTREVAKGKFYNKVDVSSNDEVGSLALAINDLGQELERYRNRQRDFFANISHDLRTPISYIKGYTQVIYDKLYTDEKEKEQYLSIIINEVNQLNVLIDDLFELSKIEGGQLELYLNWINIQELIEGCLNKITLKAKQKNIQLSIELKDNIPYIYTDGARLEQLLMNILENAIRYNKLNGHVEIKGWIEKKRVHLSVEDTGIGIAEEDLPYIFERFYKTDKSRSNRVGSTGLGLSIVKHLVLLLEGEIKVKSTLHKGTTFLITLPYKIKGDVQNEKL
ncbi:ATP-binding protein [Priestia megaterium]|uniref:sensor histidine kinase n=1 Tax=Priestia TaxID=2800373 RepID=UPI001C8F0780|nr:ATP-binding protein [Priestia aryabhattai]MBY0029819.1 HAMP domain-containing protein [Priestia aryabhattai]